jgi:hypothetical protein
MRPSDVRVRVKGGSDTVSFTVVKHTIQLCESHLRFASMYGVVYVTCEITYFVKIAFSTLQNYKGFLSSSFFIWKNI